MISNDKEIANEDGGLTMRTKIQETSIFNGTIRNLQEKEINSDDDEQHSQQVILVIFKLKLCLAYTSVVWPIPPSLT